MPDGCSYRSAPVFVLILAISKIFPCQVNVAGADVPGVWVKVKRLPLLHLNCSVIGTGLSVQAVIAIRMVAVDRIFFFMGCLL